MPSINHTESYRKFKGLMPSLGNLQHPEPRVIRGRNFRWQLSGPYSGWGNSIAAPPIPGSRWFATFAHDNTIVACSELGIYTLDTSSVEGMHSPCGVWKLAISCQPIDIPADDPSVWIDYDYPWSSAYVGSAYYFAHPLIGIVEHEICTDTWRCLPLSCEPTPLRPFPKQPSTNPLATPQPTLFTDATLASAAGTPMPAYAIAPPIFSITQANNKLIVLARDTVSWSEADAGANLDCDIHRGSGFQSLSAASYGRPLAVRESPNGFIVYTTNAMLYFETVCSGSLCQFRVSRVSRDITPINPYCIVSHDASMHILLSKQGLYTTDGSYPKPWEPVVGRYLVENEIPRLQLLADMQLSSTLIPGNSLDAAAIAFSQHAIAMFYSPTTLELFISLRDHHATDETPLVDDRWVADPSVTSAAMRENPLAPNCYRRSLVFNEAYGEWSSFDQPHRYIGPANATIHRQHSFVLGFIHHDKALRLFDCSRYNADLLPNSDCTQVQLPLDSFIQLGPFEYPIEASFQQRSEAKQVSIHTGPLISTERTRLAQTANERPDQWRDASQVWSWYTAKLASTDDGYTVINSQWSDLFLVSSTFYRQTFSCSNNGLAHMLNIGADHVGMFYELNRVDINVLITGVL